VCQCVCVREREFLVTEQTSAAEAHLIKARQHASAGFKARQHTSAGFHQAHLMKARQNTSEAHLKKARQHT
jgi:hypothetical protein